MLQVTTKRYFGPNFEKNVSFFDFGTTRAALNVSPGSNYSISINSHSGNSDSMLAIQTISTSNFILKLIFVDAELFWWFTVDHSCKWIN